MIPKPVITANSLQIMMHPQASYNSLATGEGEVERSDCGVSGGSISVISSWLVFALHDFCSTVQLWTFCPVLFLIRASARARTIFSGYWEAVGFGLHTQAQAGNVWVMGISDPHPLAFTAEKLLLVIVSLPVLLIALDVYSAPSFQIGVSPFRLVCLLTVSSHSCYF